MTCFLGLIHSCTPSPSTAAILSAAVRTTVPDYFGNAWEDSTPRPFAANGGPPSASQPNGESNKGLGAGEEKSRKGHSRNRSQAGKSSTSTGSNRNSKQPSQKAMLSKALQKANTAVLLDNAQNFEGAMQAYSEASFKNQSCLPMKVVTSLPRTWQISSGTNQIVAPIFRAILILSLAFIYASSSVLPGVTRS